MRTCKREGCHLEALPRRQWCEECWLARQPPMTRVNAAKRRLSLIPEHARRKRVPDKDWPPGRRWCAGCQTFVRLEDCTASRCKACASTANHESAVRAVFGLPGETYQWLLDLQCGRCAICRAKPAKTRLAVDHDHNHTACGGKGCRRCVRGLICSRCNHELLGAAHDSLHILRNAVAYLERPPMSGEWSLPDYEREEYRAQWGSDDPPPF